MQTRLVILLFLVTSTIGGQHERRLLKHLFIKQQHDPLERPTKNDSESVSVHLAFSFINLIDFDIKNNVLITKFWMTQTWQDYSMTWKPQLYGNIDAIRIPTTKIWLPDIVLYNSVDENYDNYMKTNAVVAHTGQILYVSPRIFKSTCSFNTSSFQIVRINITTSTNTIDLSSYVINNKWKLIDSYMTLNEVKYECCPQAYLSVVLTIKIRRVLDDFPININGTENEDK
ncbi:unnamed protein product [Rotaria socialis]|uniref:Neurotransmitter-gated ion-channel ligand-binding domain-containing protein n=1 Tax=Rotaria socialis TaxID=392032 RepID=A0A820EW51_9BILA|nr:unnamed protein product [Rotaria socialis]CAF4252286.1 unnamed protein product [Rotaria socialis]